MGTRRIIAWALACAVMAPGACSLPSDRLPTVPPQDTELEEEIAEMTADVERQMDEMMRENQELIDQLTGERDSLSYTGVGSG